MEERKIRPLEVPPRQNEAGMERDELRHWGSSGLGGWLVPGGWGGLAE